MQFTREAGGFPLLTEAAALVVVIYLSESAGDNADSKYTPIATSDPQVVIY